MSADVRRSPELIRREMADLANYLEGLPAELRSSGILRSYETRLSRLESELLVASVAELVQHRDLAKQLRLHPAPDEPAVILASLDRTLTEAQTSIRGRLRRTRLIHQALNGGMFAVAVGAIIAGHQARWSPIPSMVLLVLLYALNLLYDGVDRAVEEERLLARFSSVQDELKTVRLAKVEAGMRAGFLSQLQHVLAAVAETEPLGSRRQQVH